MREIMTKMIENYDAEIQQLKDSIKAKMIWNPSHSLYKKLAWFSAKREAVLEVLNEYDKAQREHNE